MMMRQLFSRRSSSHRPLLALYTLCFLLYATLLFFLFPRHTTFLHRRLLRRSSPSPHKPQQLPHSLPPPSPLPPPPYAFLKKACMQAEDPKDCFSTLSAVPSTAAAANAAAVMQGVLRHVIQTLEASKAAMMDQKRRNNGTLAAREVLTECSDFVDTGLRFLRKPGFVAVDPGPVEALDVASFYVYTCIRLVKDIEDGYDVDDGSSMEASMQALLGGVEHLCRVGSDFGHMLGFDGNDEWVRPSVGAQRWWRGGIPTLPE